MADSGLCLYNMPDGTVKCSGCDQPPVSGTNKRPAPVGLSEGIYPADDPRLSEGGEVLPESGGEV